MKLSKMPDLFLKTCISAAICGVLAFSLPAHAQYNAGTFSLTDDPNKEYEDWGVGLEDPVIKKNSVTTDEYIALLYHRMTNRAPRYRNWLRYDENYAAATEMERQTVAEDLILKWQDAYKAINYKDPVYVEQEIEISPYNKKYQGYLIKGIDKDSIFDFKYAGKRYAIIPTKMETYQWIPASGQAVDFIEQGLGEDRKAIGVFTIDIKYADRNTPFILRDNKYWLFMGTARKMEILTSKERSSLWSSDQNLNIVQRQRALLDLFRYSKEDKQKQADPFFDE